MHARKLAIIAIALVLLLYACFHIRGRYFSFKLLEIGEAVRYVSTKNNSTNECFSEFLKLLQGWRTESADYLLVEPDPPIPISRVRAECRYHLVPEPLTSFLSEERKRCYSHQFVTDRTRPRVRAGLKIIKKLFDDHKIPLIVAGGSLLGSLRYHGIIPYDDDFDFRVPRNKIDEIRAFLQDLCRRDSSFWCHSLDLRKMDHFQVWFGIQDPKKKDYASFIDFFFYDIVGDKIHVLDGPKTYPKTVLFPTIKRPLEGDLYDFPRDSLAYRKFYYGPYSLTECHGYDHIGNQRKGCQRVPCAALSSFLPMLVSSENSLAQLELVVNNSFVKSIFYRRKRSVGHL